MGKLKDISDVQLIIVMGNWMGEKCIIWRLLPSFPLRKKLYRYHNKVEKKREILIKKKKKLGYLEVPKSWLFGSVQKLFLKWLLKTNQKQTKSCSFMTLCNSLQY